MRIITKPGSRKAPARLLVCFCGPEITLPGISALTEEETAYPASSPSCGRHGMRPVGPLLGA